MDLISEKIKILPKYDTSKKEFEVQYRYYTFFKYNRKLKHKSDGWLHFKYYKTINGAIDSLKEFRKKGVWDYPGESIESNYPKLIPTLTIRRYRIVKRDFF